MYSKPNRTSKISIFRKNLRLRSSNWLWLCPWHQFCKNAVFKNHAQFTKSTPTASNFIKKKLNHSSFPVIISNQIFCRNCLWFQRIQRSCYNITSILHMTLYKCCAGVANKIRPTIGNLKSSNSHNQPHSIKYITMAYLKVLLSRPWYNRSQTLTYIATVFYVANMAIMPIRLEQKINLFLYSFLP